MLTGIEDLTHPTAEKHFIPFAMIRVAKARPTARSQLMAHGPSYYELLAHGQRLVASSWHMATWPNEL